MQARLKGGEMGWRERDYARWTDEERRRFLGSGGAGAAPIPSECSDYPARPAPAARGGVVRPGAGFAILVMAGLVALGQLPRGHPVVPRLHVGLPGLANGSVPTQALPPPTGTISGPSSAAFGSTLTLHGTAPAGNGLVTVEGSYDGGRSWLTLTSVASTNGTYATQIPLNQRGLLQLRIVFADGSTAVGSLVVR